MQQPALAGPARPASLWGDRLVQNRIYAAFETYEKLLSQKPDFVPAYIQLGLLCLQVGVIGRGMEYLQAALSCDPTTHERGFIKAKLHEKARFIHGRGLGR